MTKDCPSPCSSLFYYWIVLYDVNRDSIGGWSILADDWTLPFHQVVGNASFNQPMNSGSNVELVELPYFFHLPLTLALILDY